ncbi:acyl-CoA dehydrogenase family protein [Streptomyces diastatochromogenes]|nr:acyl-CoA dehydrogenase family protein [Streptomyces diastatochromogenes]
MGRLARHGDSRGGGPTRRPAHPRPRRPAPDRALGVRERDRTRRLDPARHAGGTAGRSARLPHPAAPPPGRPGAPHLGQRRSARHGQPLGRRRGRVRTRTPLLPAGRPDDRRTRAGRGALPPGAVPLVAALLFCAPALGAARGALDAWTALAEERGASADPGMQRTLARCSGDIDAAALLLESAAQRADRAALTPPAAFEPETAARNQRDASRAAELLTDAVEHLFRTAGARALTRSNPCSAPGATSTR